MLGNFSTRDHNGQPDTVCQYVCCFVHHLQRQQHDDHRYGSQHLFLDARIADRLEHYGIAVFYYDLHRNGNLSERLYEYRYAADHR